MPTRVPSNSMDFSQQAPKFGPPLVFNTFLKPCYIFANIQGFFCTLWHYVLYSTKYNQKDEKPSNPLLLVCLLTLTRHIDQSGDKLEGACACPDDFVEDSSTA